MMAILAAAYWALALMVYVLGGEQFRQRAATSETFSAVASIGEITDGMTVTQRVTLDADRLDTIEVMTDTYARENTGTLILTIQNEAGETLAQPHVDISKAENWQYLRIPLEAPLVLDDTGDLLITLTTEGCEPGNAISILYGNTISTARYEMNAPIDQSDLFVVNGQMGGGRLCLRASGVTFLQFYKTFWLIVPGAFLLLALYSFWCLHRSKQGKITVFSMLMTVAQRYGFLLRQLVARDFKSKYKRSMLGILWSFLNPLLTMAVQYVIFSRMFKSDISNFAVYLIVGTIFFNFLTDSVTNGMLAITGNATLIKKVYMPKYIYPVSKVCSSLINFTLTLIPMVLVILLTGTSITPKMLLLIYDVLCMTGFVLGMALIMSTAMTFFQDTQFLWSVLSLLWLYMTPIFYPETIIPVAFRTLYHMNPMYQYITFARTVIIDGVSPDPLCYLWCLLAAALFLLVGSWVFRKHQDRFIMYL